MVFELYKEWIKDGVKANIPLDIFFKGNENLPDLKKMLFKLLTQTGKFYIAKDILKYSSVDDYITKIKTERNNSRKLYLKYFFCNGYDIRELFCFNSVSSKLADELDIIVDVLEEFYNPKTFTDSAVKKAMMLLSEKDYGNIRIGILAKAEPYDSEFTLTVRGVVGSFVDSIEGDGSRVSELLGDSYQFSMTKTYTTLPKSLDDVINDFLAIKILETLKPVHYIRNDLYVKPIYPTYDQFINSGGKVSSYTIEGKLC